MALKIADYGGSNFLSLLAFSLAIGIVGLFSNFVIFRKIKVVEHIWDPCCPPVVQLLCPELIY